MFPLAFVAGWLQGHWWGFISRNYVVWPTFLLMNVFIALKGSHFWFLFIIWPICTTLPIRHICCYSDFSRQMSKIWSGPMSRECLHIQIWSGVRLNDDPDSKLFILVGLGRSFFVCCLAHRGSTVGFLLLQCSSGVVRHPRDLQVSVATHFCRVLIFASS